MRCAERRIAGAAIDCFAEEPVTRPHRFGELDNVLLAPHSIAWTDELFRDIGRSVCQGMLDLSLGKRPRGVVNPQVFERPGFQEKWARLRGRHGQGGGGPSMSRRLEGQTAWISGAASGIGAATARLVRGRGRECRAGRRRRARGTGRTEIVAAGGTAAFLACRRPMKSRSATPWIRLRSRFGGLHIIVNCAGMVHVKLLHEYDEADWDRLMGVNLKSIFFSVKHGLPHLRTNPRSYVVNVGSISSFVGQAATPAYTASKSAVLGLSRSIALDYAAVGLRCNCVCPGDHRHADAARAPGQDRRPRGDAGRTAAPRPYGWALQPADIARAVLYLSCAKTRRA